MLKFKTFQIHNKIAKRNIRGKEGFCLRSYSDPRAKVLRKNNLLSGRTETIF